MKKLVLALAVIASVSMISCTNNAEQATEETVDSTAVVDSAATEAAAPAEEAAPAE